MCSLLSSFFYRDAATPEIYPLSLHDALPICEELPHLALGHVAAPVVEQAHFVARHDPSYGPGRRAQVARSEEHTSELQSRQYLVCRLLLEKKKKNSQPPPSTPSPTRDFHLPQ